MNAWKAKGSAPWTASSTSTRYSSRLFLGCLIHLSQLFCSCSLFLATQFQPKRWVLIGARNFHGHFRSFWFSLEEGIHDLQNQRFRTVGGVGKRGVHLESSMKIDLVRNNIVVPVHLRESARNAERQTAECRGPVGQLYTPLQARKDRCRIVILLIP